MRPGNTLSRTAIEPRMIASTLVFPVEYTSVMLLMPLSSLAHAEIAEPAACRRPFRLDQTDAGGTRSSLKGFEEAFECGAVTLSRNLHCAVGLVAHPAFQAQLDGAMLREIAEAHALHPPMYDGVKLVVFAHGRFAPR